MQQPTPMQMQKMMMAQGQTMGQGQLPGGNQFQFFPIQVGGPTPYARSRRLLFIGVGVYQLVMAMMALIEFQNFLSGIIMIFGVLAGGLALKEDMNITYICWFGMISAAGCIAGIVGALIGFAVKISTIVIKFNIPLSCFFGMAVAWWIYADYEAEHPESTDMVASWLRAFGLMKPKVVPVAASNSMTLLGTSGLPNFGNPTLAGFENKISNDLFKQQGQQYNQAMGQANGYGAMANNQLAYAQGKATEGGAAGAGWFGNANAAAMGAAGGAGAAGAAGAGWFGKAAGNANAAAMGAQAGAGGAFATMPGGAGGFPQGIPQGAGDVRRDPFLTQ